MTPDERGGLVAYCTESAGDTGDTEVWLAGLELWGLPVLVRAALVAVDQSLVRLRDLPAVEVNVRPLMRASARWAQASDILDHAIACAHEASLCDNYADAAESASSQVGDWWSYAHVHAIGDIPAIIAWHEGISPPLMRFRGRPADAIVQSCVYFSQSPPRDPITPRALRGAISHALVAWARERGDPATTRWL